MEKKNFAQNIEFILVIPLNVVRRTFEAWLLIPFYIYVFCIYTSHSELPARRYMDVHPISNLVNMPTECLWDVHLLCALWSESDKILPCVLSVLIGSAADSFLARHTNPGSHADSKSSPYIAC